MKPDGDDWRGFVIIIAGAIVVIAFFILIAGCAPAVTVRASVCEPPPIPPAALVPCDLPKPIPDGRLETLYLQYFVDTAMYGECVRRFNNLKAQVAYRDAKIKECIAASQPGANPWWK